MQPSEIFNGATFTKTKFISLLDAVDLFSIVTFVGVSTDYHYFTFTVFEYIDLPLNLQAMSNNIIMLSSYLKSEDSENNLNFKTNMNLIPNAINENGQIIYKLLKEILKYSFSSESFDNVMNSIYYNTFDGPSGSWRLLVSNYISSPFFYYYFDKLTHAETIFRKLNFDSFLYLTPHSLPLRPALSICSYTDAQVFNRNLIHILVIVNSADVDFYHFHFWILSLLSYYSRVSIIYY